MVSSESSSCDSSRSDSCGTSSCWLIRSCWWTSSCWGTRNCWWASSCCWRCPTTWCAIKASKSWYMLNVKPEINVNNLNLQTCSWGQTRWHSPGCCTRPLPCPPWWAQGQWCPRCHGALCCPHTASHGSALCWVGTWFWRGKKCHISIHLKEIKW